MNKRIEELIKQATECYSNGQERTFDKEKFAQLIIKECAEVAGCNAHVSGFALGDLIKEHFE